MTAAPRRRDTASPGSSATPSRTRGRRRSTTPRSRQPGSTGCTSRSRCRAGRARDAVQAVRALGLAGLNVTMPHKADAAWACDELTPDADRARRGERGHVDRRRACSLGDVHRRRGLPALGARRGRRPARAPTCSCSARAARRGRSCSRSAAPARGSPSPPAGATPAESAAGARARRGTRSRSPTSTPACFDARRQRHAARDAGRAAAVRRWSGSTRASSWSTPCTTRWRRRCSPPPAPAGVPCRQRPRHARAPGRARVRALDRRRRAARRRCAPPPPTDPRA